MAVRLSAKLLVLLTTVLVLVSAPQVAQAAYTYIFYKSGNGTENIWYYSAYQNNIAGGYVGTVYSAGYVQIRTRQGSNTYASGTGTGETYLTHARVNNHQSSCRFYDGFVSVDTMGCQWRYYYT
jgi:hypothetical protein